MNFLIFFKFFFFPILIIFSINLLYNGFNKLSLVSINKENKVDQNNILFNEKVGTRVESKKKKNDQKIDNIEKKLEISEINEEKKLLIVKKNDTFSKIIRPYVQNSNQEQEIIKEISKEFNLRSLNIGQEIEIFLIKKNNISEINRIILPINFNTDLVLERNKNLTYSIKKVNLKIVSELNSKNFVINTSLFEDGKKSNLPLSILSDVIQLYSFDIDFQRDIQKGNKLEILYESYFNTDRKKISYGKIKYINLILQNNSLEYFIFNTSDGFFDYFNKEGKNVKKALMKTPLDGAKLSSSYGMRKHPILGYNKMHLGVDFAAPKGTPVFAAGNGVIEFVGRNGGYGKYIRIRHNNSYKTAYAHLNGFQKGISRGVRVNQGQIIGYVGSTGRSTGPHLHYEVIYQNKKINPMKMKLPSGKKLKNEELKNFKKEIKNIYADYLYYLYE